MFEVEKKTDINHDLFERLHGFLMYVLICAGPKTLTFAPSESLMKY